MPRARFTVAYDGGAFHGFAANDGVTTVAGTITEAMSRVAGHEIALTGAGRTDAGVHGWGQVISLDLPAETDLAELAHRVNRMCGPAISLRDPAWTANEFNARFSARWRQYRYTVLNTPYAHPLLATIAWHVPQPLDLAVLQLAADPLIGEHDFASFCRRPKLPPDAPPASLVRRVLSARWSQVVDDTFGVPLLRFEIRANAFCHQMVRAITGTLIDVGLGRISAGDLAAVLAARDRAAAGQVAPPQGLTLWEVGY